MKRDPNKVRHKSKILKNTILYNVDSQDTIVCDGKRKTVQRCYFDVWKLDVLPAFVLIAPKGLSIMTVKDSFTAEEMKYLLLQILDKEKEWISK